MKIFFVFPLCQSFDYLDQVGSDDDWDALSSNQPESSHQVEEEQVKAKAGLESESADFFGLKVKVLIFEKILPYQSRSLKDVDHNIPKPKQSDY